MAAEASGASGWHVLARVPSPLVLLDATGTVVQANAAAARVLAAATVAGDALADRLVPAGRRDLLTGIGEALADGSPHRREGDDPVEVLVELAGDEPRFLNLSLSPFEPGTVVGALADMTEFFRVMLVVAYAANTTMVIDENFQILWGPVGRYAAQELASPWYGRGAANPLGWLHPDDISAVLEGFTHVLDHPGVVHEMTVRSRHVMLEDLWGTATIRAINVFDEPLLHGVLLQTQAEEPHEKVSLGRTTGMFNSIAEVAPIGIILSDHTGRSTYWNEVAGAMFGLAGRDPAEAPSADEADWPGRCDASHRDELRALLTAGRAGHRGSLTCPFDLPSLGEHWLSVTVAPQINDLGDPMGWLATLQDVTAEIRVQQELTAAQERLRHLAGHDPLTGLANRRLLVEQLDAELAERDCTGELALFFCDLDSFKPVNDQRGHETGDAVLVEVADRLRAAVREQDLVARLGGDEFVVLVHGFRDIAELEHIAGRLLDAVGQRIDVGEVEVAIGVSIGIATAETGDDADAIVVRADKLMYQAKAAGKGRYAIERP